MWIINSNWNFNTKDQVLEYYTVPIYVLQEFMSTSRKSDTKLSVTMFMNLKSIGILSWYLIFISLKWSESRYYKVRSGHKSILIMFINKRKLSSDLLFHVHTSVSLWSWQWKCLGINEHVDQVLCIFSLTLSFSHSW